MSTFARRRIIQDVSRILREPPKGTLAQPFPDNIMYCHAIINGSEGTIWECGIFHLIIKFSEEYPTKPPSVKFITKIFHPNGNVPYFNHDNTSIVYNDGKICLDILQNQWTPMYDIAAILMSIQALLNDPNPSSPANTEAAELFTENKQLYEYRVLQSVEDSWLIPQVKDCDI